MSKGIYKKLTFEDKFARKWYCNSWRFTSDMKQRNRKELRRKLGKDMDNKMKKLSNEEMIMVGQKCTCESCGSPHGVYCINPYLEDVEQEQVLACLCEDCYDRYIDDI